MMTSFTGAKLATIIALSAATIGCASSAFSTKNDAMYCEIKASDMGGMIMLENLVHADTAIQGTYRFKLKSTGGGGSTNISQGSNFTASPGSPATLGRMMLNSGVIYEAKLDVTVNGVSFTCAERIGGAV
ncbi:MAG: hypothetical protein COA52_18120 [Hyphomicrobiales bacterium]|nr:hypothetical protein [Hyphomicrobiales bacterium]PCJ83948.1 MAG: hypothetical protein COA52_18120 [Hyphomicrobiales bacterium]